MSFKFPPRHLLFATLSGLLSGAAASFFLWLLSWATQARVTHPSLIWLLPFAGFAIGWIYDRHGRDVAGGNTLIFEEIHDPRKIMPLRMAPLILLSTVVTHLFGGSAGREGTAVQMGASLSDQVTKFFRTDATERRLLLMCGLGAGFGAAIGAPWAGMVFGIEVLYGRLRPDSLIQLFIASFVAFGTTIALHAPHTIYPQVVLFDFDVRLCAWVAVLGLGFGLTARIFSLLVHAVERLQKRYVRYVPLKPALAGLLLVAFYRALGTDRYAGLGIPVIQDSFYMSGSLRDVAFKAIATAVTIGSGFKGGEFVPLVFIGSVLGSFCAGLLALPIGIVASLGFAAVFAGAANTPFACTIMAMELFGSEIGPYALVACLASYLASGRQGIYPAQRLPESGLRLFRRRS